MHHVLRRVGLLLVRVVVVHHGVLRLLAGRRVGPGVGAVFVPLFQVAGRDDEICFGDLLG